MDQLTHNSVGLRYQSAVNHGAEIEVWQNLS